MTVGLMLNLHPVCLLLTLTVLGFPDGSEDSLEKGSVFLPQIPQTEEPGELHPWGREE